MGESLFKGKIIDENDEWVCGSMIIYSESNDFVIHSSSGKHIGTFHVDPNSVELVTSSEENP